MPNFLRRLASQIPASVVACLLTATSIGIEIAAAGDLRPAWECLPADTALMARLPEATEFVEMLRKTTRFGAVALQPERLDGLLKLVVEQAATDDAEASGSLAEWEESLAKYGLKTDDLAAAFSKDIGGGLVVRQREGDLPPLRMLLAWAEPGEEVAAKLLAAVKQRLEEAVDEDDGPAPQRIDLELAGHDVVSLVVPVMGLDTSGIEEADEDEIARLTERLDKIQIGQTHVFHTMLGGRVLYGTTLPAESNGEAEGIVADSDGDDARRIFGAFLAAHDQDDESPLARVIREPALAAAALPGLPLVEVVFVPRLLFTGDVGTHAMRLAQVGLDDVGGVVWRQAFAEGSWRSTIAATLPAPRHGMLAMLDQRCDACDIPSFVTREAIDFTQISLDLGAAFATIREVLGGDESAEQLTNMLNVADVQASTWLGTDVATLLSGVGSRHWVLSFPPRIAEAVAAARKAGNDETVELTGTDSLAMVWEVADEEAILKLLGMLAPMAGVEIQEEQGFRGLRLPGSAAAYVGRGYLVLAMGDGTLEKTLNAIRNPPAGDVSWRESAALRRARRLIDLPPSRMFAVGDSTRTGGMLGTLRDYIEVLEPGDLKEESRDLLVAGKKLMPTAAEMEGMFGVGVSVLRMNDDGLVLESAWEMPAP